MLRYAQLLEIHGLPDWLKTWNLHYSVRHLPEQEERRGPTGADLELWGERVVQLLKELTGGRTTHGFEKVGRPDRQLLRIWPWRKHSALGPRFFLTQCMQC
jgi:hypothetical protein